MVHATDQFEFEWQLWKWASGFARRLTGHGHTNFLVRLDDDQCVTHIELGQPGGAEGERPPWEEELETLPAFIYWNPFDGPEYQALSWRNIERDTMERLAGVKLGLGIAATLRPHEPVEFPTSWQVVF